MTSSVLKSPMKTVRMFWRDSVKLCIRRFPRESARLCPGRFAMVDQDMVHQEPVVITEVDLDLVEETTIIMAEVLDSATTE